MNRRIFRFITLISLASACLLSAGCETQPSGANAPEAAPAAYAPAPEPSAAPVMHAEAERTPSPDAVKSTAPVETPEPVSTPEAAHEPTPEPTPEAAHEHTPEPTPAPEPEDTYTGPDLTECEPVEDGFFSDAAFLGNSLVDGLSRYGGLRHGSFYAATSASVVNVDMTRNSYLESGDKATLIEAMTEKEYGKIYILLGINEIGFDPDYFSRLYGAMLDRIRRDEPEADIYIMSLSPVTEACSGDSDVFNMERIGLYNDALYALAQEKECYYVDLCQALAGEDGYLSEAESTDGIHLKPEKYPDWAEYLRTHVKE